MYIKRCSIPALFLFPLIAYAGGGSATAGFTLALRIKAPSSPPDACELQREATYSGDWSQLPQTKGQYVDLMRSEGARQRADRYFQSRCSMELLCKSPCL